MRKRHPVFYRPPQNSTNDVFLNQQVLRKRLSFKADIMLKQLIILVILISSSLSAAQEAAVDSIQQNPPMPDAKTLSQDYPVENLLDEPVRHRVYGAPVLKFSGIGPTRQNSLVVGGEIGWVMNKTYMLGLGLYGLSTHVDAPAIEPIQGLLLVTNYAGLLVGYRHKPHKLLHLEAQSLFGIGEAFYRDRDFDARFQKADVYLVVEPAVNGVLNVTSALRLAAGVSYRYANGISILGMTSADLSGVCLNLALQAGTF